MEKIQKVLIACEKVIDGIEEESISTTSALLQCLKIARITNDDNALIWLQYEYGGYPITQSGHIEKDAFIVATNHGRGFSNDGKQYIFTELASELEEKIHAEQSAVGNFTTQGTSVGGNYAVIAMNTLTNAVTHNTSTYVKNISTCQQRLSKLKAQYYEYALKKQIEITFGNIATDIFSRYRERVDNYFAELSEETIVMLKAIDGRLESGNEEEYSQALTTCRRLFDLTASDLFKKHFSSYESNMYKTKSGKEIDITGDHTKNKLSAIIELLEEKSTDKTLVGSNIAYLLDWIEKLTSLQSKGVHNKISRNDAERCIIQTYICLGNILDMQ